MKTLPRLTEASQALSPEHAYIRESGNLTETEIERLEDFRRALPESPTRPSDPGPSGIGPGNAGNDATGQPAGPRDRHTPFVHYRHDSDNQTAHVLVRYGWQGRPEDRLTGYRARNDQIRREHDGGASMRDLGQAWGMNASTVCRAIKESKHREVMVSEAIREKMARTPAAEVEFIRPLRTDKDSPRRNSLSSTMLVSSKRGRVVKSSFFQRAAVLSANGFRRRHNEVPQDARRVL